MFYLKTPKSSIVSGFGKPTGTRANSEKLKGPWLVGTFSSKLQCSPTTLPGTSTSIFAWIILCKWEKQTRVEEELGKNLLSVIVRTQPLGRGTEAAPQFCSHLEETYQARQLLVQPKVILWKKGKLWAFNYQYHSSWGGTHWASEGDQEREPRVSKAVALL